MVLIVIPSPKYAVPAIVDAGAAFTVAPVVPWKAAAGAAGSLVLGLQAVVINSVAAAARTPRFADVRFGMLGQGSPGSA